MFCSKCGCKLNNEALFCHNCGEKVSINKNLENSIEKESREIELNRTALKIYLYDIPVSYTHLDVYKRQELQR